MTFFNFYYFVFFAFVPINVILFGEAVVRQKYAYQAFGHGDEYTALCLLLSYLLFLIGWMANPSIGSGFGLKMQRGETYSLRKAARVAFAFFFIGLIAMSYNVVQVGGALEVIREAPNIRSGEFEFESRFVFIRQFISFLSCAFILFLAVYLGKKIDQTRLTVVDKAALIVMAVLFFYYVLSAAGRREFIYPVLLYYLVSSSAGRSFGLKVTVLVIFALIVAQASVSLATSGLSGLDEIIRYKDEVFQLAYLNTVQGLADSFIHFAGMQHADLWQFGFLTDILELPLQLVPSRLLEFDRGRGMFGETSQFLLGEGLADNLSGEEPPGFHGYLLVNFGYFGMFVLFFLSGAAYRLLHNVFKPAERKDAIAWLIYWWIFVGFLALFREGVLALALKQYASWWFATGLLLFTRQRQARPEAAQAPGRSASLA